MSPTTETIAKDRIAAQLVIIMPVFEDRESVQILMQDLKRDIAEDFIVICVEDGSLNNPLLIEDLKDAGIKGEIIYLTRNMGHQRAIATGIRYVHDSYTAERTVIMDSDGEDKPSSIAEMLLAFDDKTDVVTASRKSRQETLQFKTFYVVYKFIFKLLTGRFVNFGNFMILNRSALSRMASVNETWLHVAGAVLLSRARIMSISLDRGSRYRGQSKMNFPGLVLHGMRAVMVFAEDVLVRILVACFGLMVILGLTVFIIFGMKGLGFASPGWASIALGLIMIIITQVGATVLFMLLSSGGQKGQAPLPAVSIDTLIRRIVKTES